MFKKSLFTISLIVASVSFASENNNNNNGNKYGFDNNAKHTGTIYTGSQKDYSYINVQDQYGNDISPESKREREIKDKEMAYQIMSAQNHDSCVIN